MKVIGIDIGTATTGWAVVEKRAGNFFTVDGFGIVSTSPKDSMPNRLFKIHSEISEIIDKFYPSHMAIEDLFFFKNQKTVIKVGQARGVAIVCAVAKGLEVFDYTPLQVKQAVTGYGRAEKAQIQQMVKMILGFNEIPKPDDAADALAISICHLNTVKN